MKKVFSYQSYKKFLKDLIESMGRGAVAKLAEAAGCNRTYLSQCFFSKVQLTSDHILGIAEYLQLSEEEEDFLLLLLLYERASNRKTQQRIKIKMDKLIQANLELSKKIKSKFDSDELSEEQKQKYYSSWKYAAVHSAVSIRDFSSTISISKKLHLSEQEVSLILKDLEEMNLLEGASGKWVHTGKNLHVPTGSFYMSQNHINWRLKSFESINRKNSVHYTSVFSLSKNDWESLREQMLSFIERQRDYIHSSGSEEMYCFCCDLFQPFE